MDHLLGVVSGISISFLLIIRVSISLLGTHLRGSQVHKTNFMLKFNNFLAKVPIFNLETLER